MGARENVLHKEGVDRSVGVVLHGELTVDLRVVGHEEDVESPEPLVPLRRHPPQHSGVAGDALHGAGLDPLRLSEHGLVKWFTSESRSCFGF